DQQQRKARAYRRGQGAVGPQQHQQVLAWLQRPNVQQVLRRQSQTAQPTCQIPRRQRTQIWADAQMHAGDVVGWQTKRVNHLLSREISVSQDVCGAREAVAELALEGEDAVRGVPLRVQ